MKKLLLLLSISIYHNCFSQTLLIESGNEYIINREQLLSTDLSKKCFIINIISKKWIAANDTKVKPMVVLKIFSDSSEKISFQEVKSIKNYTNLLTIQQIVQKAANTVSTHLLLKVSTLIQQYGEEAVFDGLKKIVLKSGNKLYEVNGEIICQFFNLLDFEQLSLVQSNVSIINTKAIAEKAFYQKVESTNDSFAVRPFSLSEKSLFDLQGKIFLEKRNADSSFHFYRVHFMCQDCIFRGFEAFDYMQNIGIINFTSKIPIRFFRPIKVRERNSEVYEELAESEKYYHFLKNATANNKMFN
jgi:hypothetical protein